jgi:hypothetical protein
MKKITVPKGNKNKWVGKKNDFQQSKSKWALSKILQTGAENLTQSVLWSDRWRMSGNMGWDLERGDAQKKGTSEAKEWRREAELDIGCCKKKAGRKKIERQKSQIMRQKKKELW